MQFLPCDVFVHMEGSPLALSFWSLYPFTLIFEGGRSELPIGRLHPSLPLVICFSEPGLCAAQTTKAQVLDDLSPC